MKLGKAFSDNLFEERKQSHSLVFESHSRVGWWTGYGRTLVFASILLLSLFILTVRLFHLTIIRGHEYRLLADGNRIRERVRYAPRGILYDRTGVPLVENIPYYRLNKPCESNINTPCVNPISIQEGDEKIKNGMPPGWFVEKDFRRSYLYPESFAHVIGFTGELSKQELEDEYYNLRGYSMGERIGRFGSEIVFEDRLRGRKGKELIEVDAAGNQVRILGVEEELPGEAVTLSLDRSLSHVIKSVFPENKKGAVIVSNPQTGEIMALYSSPTFNPNKFSEGISNEEYFELTTGENMVMLNRAIGGIYPPGSTYKIVTSLAALEEGAITSQTLIEDTGVISIPPFEFPNWYFTKYGKTDGMVDIVKALQRSNDIFFYKTGEALGITRLYKWARRLGVGSTLGVELVGEAEGLMPDPVWKNKRFSSDEDISARHNEWYLGDTYHVSIGQGYLLVTPLQVNTWTNIIANGGKLCHPTIEKHQSVSYLRKKCRDMGIHKENIKLILEGMKRACSPGGTGYPLFNFQIPKTNTDLVGTNFQSTSSGKTIPKISIPVACKTGTAEFGDPENKTHAWFTVFAPIPNEYVNPNDYNSQTTMTGEPEISITVLVEGAGEGSDVAAPIAKSILEEWFQR